LVCFDLILKKLKVWSLAIDLKDNCWAMNYLRVQTFIEISSNILPFQRLGLMEQMNIDLRRIAIFSVVFLLRGHSLPCTSGTISMVLSEHSTLVCVFVIYFVVYQSTLSFFPLLNTLSDKYNEKLNILIHSYTHHDSQ